MVTNTRRVQLTGFTTTQLNKIKALRFYSMSAINLKPLLQPKSTSVNFFRYKILTNYWRILSFFNQFRRTNAFKTYKFLIPKLFINKSYSNRLNYLYSKKLYKAVNLQKKEKLAWQRYIFRFRIWYNLYRYLYTDKTLNNNLKFSNTENNFLTTEFYKLQQVRARLCYKLTFNNLYSETDVAYLLPWRSRKFWAVRAYSSLFTKRVFFKRFYTFRIERGFVKKQFKNGQKKKTFKFSNL